MKDSGMRPGYGYLGEWAGKDKRFLDKLLQKGFWCSFGEHYVERTEEFKG